MNKIRELLFFLFAVNICYAGTVTDLIDYREYRDFAENRGKYKVGNTNIVVTRKDGVTKTITVPMPDFSSTDSNAIGTLIDPTYVTGVKHNTLMTSVRFGYAGGHDYKFVDRNDHPTDGVDRHVPRLNKLVTDVAPTVLGPGTADYKNTYEIYMRVGSGHQYVTSSTTGDREDLVRSYTYLTGGTIASDFLGNNLVAWDRGWYFNNSAVDKNILPIHLDPGDSGSPLWGYNKNTKQWELIAFGVAGSDAASYYVSVEPEFYEREIAADTKPDIKDNNVNEVITWSGITDATGTGTIKQGDKEWSYDGLKSGSLLSSASNDDLNFAKHITFDGEGGTIELQDHINMGAGKLTFKNDYTMEGVRDDISWVGAGIDIAKDKTVTWKVRGQAGDNLHKIGDGTLLVEGTGVNEGGLNVGSGTVVLNQQADSSGKKQAFSNIDIVSGRATVVLSDSQQIDTDKIRFMFRGGKLDVNGNDLTFGKIVAYDDGAQIINNSDKKAVLELDATKGLKNALKSSVYKGQLGEKGKEIANKIDLNIHGAADYAQYEEKSFGITGGINIDGDINYSSKGLNLVFQGVRDLHADEDVGTAPGKGEYYLSNFKFNNLYIRDREEGEYYHHGFIGGIYSNIEGNIIIEDSSSAVLGYLDDKWIQETTWGTTETSKTVLLYDLNDQKSIEDSISQIGLTDSNVSDEIKEGTTIYTGKVTIKDKGTLDVGATYFTGGIEALNSGNISMTNTKIEATLNIGENVEAIFKNSVGNIRNSKINNNLKIQEKSLLLFDNLTLGSTGKLNIDNSIVEIDNSEITNGDTLVTGKGTLIGKKTLLNKIAVDNSTIYLENSTINQELLLTNDSEALLTGNTAGKIIVDNSNVVLSGVNYGLTPLSREAKTVENTITLSNNSTLEGVEANIVSDISFTSSDITLSDSTLTGALKGTGEIELKNTTWNINSDSDISNLSTTSSNINFISENSKEFHQLALDNISGEAKIRFNANLETGESDKLIIRGDILNSFETEIDIDNIGNNIELNKKIEIVSADKEVINKIKITNSMIDFGLVQGKLELVNDGTLGIKPNPENTSNSDEEETIVVEIPTYINKETAGSTTTAMLGEYAARVESIKNQNDLFKSEIGFKEESGYNYIGNIQQGKYESDKFREYSQTIINNGFIYKDREEINSYWTLSKGIGFIYGNSTADYEGDYSGKIINYGGFGYLQLSNKDGYYMASNIGVTYNENKINSERFYTKSQNIGVKLGYQKKIDNNLKLTFETGTDFYHISNSNYELSFKNSKFAQHMDDKYFVEIKPEVKLSKDMGIGEYKGVLYTGLGFEYNKYLFGGEPIIDIENNEHHVETAMIDKGANIKVGVENSYKNIDVTLEAEYFTGKYNNEKLKGNLKLKYKF